MPTNFSNDRLVFWIGIAGKEELRLKYANSDVLSRLNAGELTGLCFEKFRTTSPLLKGTATIRINGADRLLIKPILQDGETYILILEEILEHRHDKAAHLNGTNRQRENRLFNLINSLEDKDFEKITNTQAFERNKKPVPEDKEHEQVPKIPSFHNGEYLLLTNQQSQALELDVFFLLVAEAGYGKTLFAAEYMRKLMDRMTQSFKPRLLPEIKEGLEGEALRPITIVFEAKNPKLVKKFKEQYLEHPLSLLAYRNVQIVFKTLEELCRENVLDPQNRHLESVGQDAFSQWLKQHERAFNTRKKTKSKENPSPSPIDHSRLFSKSELLYKEFCHMLNLEKTQYLASGIPVRGTKDYFAVEERPLIWELGQAYVSSLEKEGKYDPALNPPPLKPAVYDAIIADEVQTLGPKEIEMIVGLAKEDANQRKQIVWLYGKNQSRILSNRTYFSSLGLPLIKFTKSLRNPQEVTLMANNAIRAQLHFGNPDKQEFQTEIMEPNVDKTGEIFWAEGLEIPNAMVGDPQLTIVALPEYVEEARLKFKTAFVFTPEQIQGTDCDNLVLYRMISQPIFEYISANLPAEDVEPSGNRAKTSVCSEAEFSTGEIHSAFDAFHIALTRATKTVTIFEENNRKHEYFLKTIQKGVPIKPLSYQEKTPDFNADAFLARAEIEFENGHESQALKTVALLQQQRPDVFDTQRVQAIQSSWEHKAPPTAKASSKPAKTSAQASISSEVLKIYTDRTKYKQERAFSALLENLECTKLLFTEFPGQSSSLWSYFMEDLGRAKLFREAFIKAPKFRDKIPASILSELGEGDSSPLLYFGKNLETMALFKYLIEKDSFAKNITSAAWFKRYPDPAGMIAKGISPCLVFLESELGQSLLLTLFTKNKDLLTYIPDEELAILDVICDKAPHIVRAIPGLQCEALVEKLRVYGKDDIISKMRCLAKGPRTEDKVPAEVLSLYQTFDIKELQRALSVCDFEDLFLKTYEIEGRRVRLLDKIYNEEASRKQFSKCLVNNTNLLYMLPFGKIPEPCNGEKREVWLSCFMKLKKISDAIRHPSKTQVLSVSAMLKLPLVIVAVYLKLDKEIFTYLSEFGADLNETLPDGSTAAHEAAFKGEQKILRILKKLGANFTILDKKGHSLVHYTAMGPNESIELLKQLEPSLSLLQAALQGQTPAHYAIIGDNDLALKKLKKLEPDLDLRQIYILTTHEESFEHSLLRHAVISGAIKVLRTLRELDPYMPLSEPLNELGFTPLHLAALEGKVKVLEFLKNWDPNLDLDQPTRFGNTPSDLAKEAKHYEFVYALEGLRSNPLSKLPRKSLETKTPYSDSVQGVFFQEGTPAKTKKKGKVSKRLIDQATDKASDLTAPSQ